MRSLFEKFVRGGAKGPEVELRTLEEQIARGEGTDNPRVLIRAGDLAQQAERTSDALRFYGMALDGHLELGRFDVAEAICRKMIRIAPGTVRARCTLAWIVLGKHEEATLAQEAVRDYVETAFVAGQEGYAAKQLHLMADAARDPALLETIAESLLELGDGPGADEVFGGVYAVRNGARIAPSKDEEERFGKMLRAALMPRTDMDKLEVGRAETGSV